MDNRTSVGGRRYDLKGWLYGTAATALISAVLVGSVSEVRAGEAQSGIEEITVTATRRAENLQDVPAAITALSSTALENMGARRYEDYLNNVPGITFNRNGSRTNDVAVRGVSRGVRTSASPTTGFYLDETSISSATSFDPSLYDVERVEVLLGPQGTLYGAGSMGGAVRVILNKPKLDLMEGSAEAQLSTIAHGGTSWLTNAMVNTPVIDNVLAVRLVAGYRSDGGFVDNLGPPIEEDTNTDKRWIARGSILLTPSDNTNIVLSAIYQSQEFGSQSFHDLARAQYTYIRYYPEGGERQDGVYSLTVNTDFDAFSLMSATSYVTNHRTNFQDSSFNARWQNLAQGLGLLGTFTYVAGPGRGYAQNQDNRTQAFSQEVRATSSGDGPLKWLTGGYFSQTRTNFRTYEDVKNIPQFANLTVAQAGDQYALSSRRQLAAFGELTYSITDALDVTAGLRYSEYTIETQATGYGVLGGAGGPNAVLATALGAGANKLTQKYLVNYKVTEDNSLYAQAAQGFREGDALRPVNLPLCEPEFRSLGLPPNGPTQFLPDSLWSYEIGSKNSFFDNRLVFNGSGYYTDWKDMQQSLTLQICRSSATINAGRAKIKGFEFSTTANPIEGLIVNASIAYTDAQIKEAPITTPALQNNRLPLIAAWTWNINAQYDFPLTGSWSGYVRADVSDVSHRWSEVLASAGRIIPGYTLVGARAGVASGPWNVAIFVQNLFDEAYPLSYNPVSPVGETLGDPRTIGVNTSFRF